MENEKMEKKGSKNVVSEKDMGDYILQRRRVFRNGMEDEAVADFKIPKTEDAINREYGRAEWNRMAIATAKTEFDDALEKGKKPQSTEKKVRAAIKATPENMQIIILHIYEGTASDAELKEYKEWKNPSSQKEEKIKEGMKKAGFGK